MRQFKVTAIIIILGVMQVIAQHPGHDHRGDRGKNVIQHLDSIVDLTDDQKASIEQLQSEFREKMKEQRQSSDERDRSKMREMIKEQREQIHGLLTDEQRELLREANPGNNRDEKMKELKEMHQEIKTYRTEQIKPTLDRLKADLQEELSEEDKQKIESVRTKVAEMRKAFIAINKEAEIVDSSANSHKGRKGKSRSLRLTREQRMEIGNFTRMELKPILEAHSEKLDKIMVDIKPLKQTWTADINNIRKKYGVEGRGIGKGHHAKGDKRKGGKDRSKDRSGNSEAHKDMGKIMFLMMDTERGFGR